MTVSRVVHEHKVGVLRAFDFAHARASLRRVLHGGPVGRVKAEEVGADIERGTGRLRRGRAAQEKKQEATKTGGNSSRRHGMELRQWSYDGMGASTTRVKIQDSEQRLSVWVAARALDRGIGGRGSRASSRRQTVDAVVVLVCR